MDQRAEHRRRVGAAAGYDDVGPLVERGGYGKGADVGVHRHHLLGQLLAGEHVGRARGTHFVEPHRQVVALDIGDLQVQARLGDSRFQSAGQGGGVQATGVGHDADAALGDLAEDRCHHLDGVGDEPPGLGVLGAAAGQQGHRDLCQVVTD